MKCVRLAAVGDVHVGRTLVPYSIRSCLSRLPTCCSSLEISHATAHRRRPIGSPLKWRPYPFLSWSCSATTTSRAMLPRRCAPSLSRLGPRSSTAGRSKSTSAGARRHRRNTRFRRRVPGASCSEFGEPLMKAFVRHSRTMADALCDSLKRLETDLRIALTHYSPIEATLDGERREIIPSSAATCSLRPSMPAAHTSQSMVTPTGDRAPGTHRVACQCATSPAPSSAGPSPCCAWTPRASPRSPTCDPSAERRR